MNVHPELSADDGDMAVVVFAGEAQLKWLFLLKPGFRHCFIFLKSNGCWIMYNPLSHKTEISVHCGLYAGDLAKWYRRAGFKAIECAVNEAPMKAAPWRLYTCVEAVKRVLGIQDGWILTPWQLYCYLRSEEKPPRHY